MGSRRAVGRGSCVLFLVRPTQRPREGLAHTRAVPQGAGPEGTTRLAHRAPVCSQPALGSGANLTCLGVQWSLPLAWPLPCVESRATCDQGPDHKATSLRVCETVRVH